jgi:hypothetical protein
MPGGTTLRNRQVTTMNDGIYLTSPGRLQSLAKVGKKIVPLSTAFNPRSARQIETNVGVSNQQNSHTNGCNRSKQTLLTRPERGADLPESQRFRQRHGRLVRPPGAVEDGEIFLVGCIAPGGDSRPTVSLAPIFLCSINSSLHACYGPPHLRQRWRKKAGHLEFFVPVGKMGL